MSQQNEYGIKTFTAGEALEEFRLVRLKSADGETVEYADEYDDDVIIGVTQAYAASGAPVTVALFGPYRTFKLTCSGAVSAENSALYLDDDGKVKNSGNGNQIAVNFETGSGDGAVIECFPVFAHTSAGAIGS